jgi:hypothetical protein
VIKSHALQRSVFSRLTIDPQLATARGPKRRKSLRNKSSRVPDTPEATVKMTSRGEGRQQRPRRRSQGVALPSPNSLDSDYNPGLAQILLNQDGTFRGTRSRVAIPFDYGLSPSRSPLSGLLRNMI